MLTLVRVDQNVLTEAAQYRIEKPRSYGSKLQNQLAKQVERAAIDAVEAADCSVKNLLSTHTDTEAAIENADYSNVASTRAEDRMNFLLRRAKLAAHINNIEDFSYMKTLTEDEKNTLQNLVKETRACATLPKRLRLEKLSWLRNEYLKYRKNVIDRVAANPVETDKTLAS